MVMRPPPPVRGWEPWRRGRFRRKWLAFWRWIFRRSCRRGHLPRRARFREIGSRYFVAMTVCARCEALLDVEGRKDR